MATTFPNEQVDISAVGMINKNNTQLKLKYKDGNPNA